MRRPPITLQGLCVIARVLLTEDPTMDDGEWRERIKCRLLDSGWRYPLHLEDIGEAMRRVEQKIPRAVPVPPAAGQAAITPAVKPTRNLFRREPGYTAAWSSVGEVIAAIKQRRSKPSDAA
jgi:hypothetical protein